MALKLQALENIEYLEALEKVRSFYKWELKKEGLTKKKRDKCLRALEIIDQRIEKRQNPDKEKINIFKVRGY